MTIGPRNRSRLLACLGAWTLALGALALSAWSALRPLPAPRAFATSLVGGGASEKQMEDTSLLVSEAALTATLRDELFPQPKQSSTAPAPAPPKLALELVAILGPPEARRAFVYEAEMQTYAELAPGDSLGSVQVVEVGARHIIVSLAGADRRLELAP